MCSEDEDFIYQLRHIGPPPSCDKVPHMMRLIVVFFNVCCAADNGVKRDNSGINILIFSTQTCVEISH